MYLFFIIIRNVVGRQTSTVRKRGVSDKLLENAQKENYNRCACTALVMS